MTSKNIIYAASNLLICHILPPQTAMNTLWFRLTLPDNMDEFSFYTLRSVKVVGLAMHLFFCSAMIGIWKKYSDRNICLLHLCLLTSLPYWSFQDISWLARRVQCQSAFDRFTLSSTRVLNSSQPRKHFEAYRFSADSSPRCWNILQNMKKSFINMNQNLRIFLLLQFVFMQ